MAGLRFVVMCIFFHAQSKSAEVFCRAVVYGGKLLFSHNKSVKYSELKYLVW